VSKPVGKPVNKPVNKPARRLVVIPVDRPATDQPVRILVRALSVILVIVVMSSLRR
jgi:hypothetical protein